MRKQRKQAARVFNKMRLPSVLKTKERQKEVKLRKNFLPTLIIIFMLWSSLAYTILFIDPQQQYAVPGFFGILFLALLFTISTLLAHTRRGLMIASGITIYLALVYMGVGNFVNLFLIIAILTITEVYFIKA